jgi:hypothetical protein
MITECVFAFDQTKQVKHVFRVEFVRAPHVSERLFAVALGPFGEHRIFLATRPRRCRQVKDVGGRIHPNRRWRGHLPGQHVALGVHIDGVLRHRVFSISSAGKRGALIRLSIRRQAGQVRTDPAR